MCYFTINIYYFNILVLPLYQISINCILLKNNIVRKDKLSVFQYYN